jgi:hypothetical protein
VWPIIWVLLFVAWTDYKQKILKFTSYAFLHNRFNVNLSSYSFSEIHVMFKSLPFLSYFKYVVTYVFKKKSSTTINKKVKLFLCWTNWALHHEGVWRSGCIDPHFLDLGTSWRWVVSFTPRPLYPRGKSPRYQLDRRLGEPQSHSGRSEEEKILDPTRTRSLTPRSSSP